MNARLAIPALLAAAALALGGCAAAPAPGDGDSDDGRIAVVAVTDAYGSIAEAIGGGAVEVTSIISGPAQDPHEYEASARDQLAVSQAQLVIVNGGGYDDFMTRLLQSSDAVVVSASEASGLMPQAAPGRSDQEAAADADADDHADTEDHADHAHAAEDSHDGHNHIEGFNEHVWYSIHAVEHIAEAITTQLLALVPDQADLIESNSSAFLAELDRLHDRVHALEHELGGGDIISTEPVAAYLLEDLGFHDATPAAFLTAIESGSGVSARILDDVLRSVEGGGIRFLAVNPQSAGPEAERVRAAAEGAGVPVIEFAETLPAGLDYLGWMASNLDAVEHALQ
ncbi:MAG TPA: zinc ABC transporter substrate-binding protein [Microbacteriaceae bacterium]|nr:zinc ABC transporter substrate-binding protein [Microbacteriaceae bacterium]